MGEEQSLRIDRHRIREAHAGRRHEYAASPRPLSIRAEVRAVENQRKTAKVGPFVIESDEGAIVGGDGTAPSPLSYFVAGLGFAVLTDMVRAFALNDVPVNELRLEIVAEFPLGAKYADSGSAVAAERVHYSVDVRSPAPPEQIEAVISWTERFCHALHTVRAPVAVDAAYRLNGEAVGRATTTSR